MTAFETLSRSGRATILLCFLVALLEGLDLQAAGVAAPGIARQFGLNSLELGWVFSAGLLGLLPGAFFGGWLADRVGRRRVLIGAVLLFGVFSLLTALTWSYPSLLVARLMTGLGLGAAMPIMIALSAEAGGERLRSTTVSLTYCGVPLGGVIAAALGLSGLGGDWKTIFYIGGIAPLLVVAMLYLWLPESAAFKRTAESVGDGEGQAGFAALLSGNQATRSVLLWISCFFTLTVLYMLLNWLPSLLIGRGFGQSQAGAVQVMFNLGGAVGALLIGRLLDRGRTLAAVLIAYLGMLVTLAGIGLVTHLALMLAVGFGAGLCAIGGQLVLYSLAPSLYPAQIRATGVGAAVAFGRLGAMAGPFVAGQILAAGAGVGGLVMAAAPGLVVASLITLGLLNRTAAAPLPTTDSAR